MSVATLKMFVNFKNWKKDPSASLKELLQNPPPVTCSLPAGMNRYRVQGFIDPPYQSGAKHYKMSGVQDLEFLGKQGAGQSVNGQALSFAKILIKVLRTQMKCATHHKLEISTLVKSIVTISGLTVWTF